MTRKQCGNSHRLILAFLMLAALLVPLAFFGSEVTMRIPEKRLLMKQFIVEFKWSKAVLLDLGASLLLIAAACQGFSRRKPGMPVTFIPVSIFVLVTAFSSFNAASPHLSLQCLALVGGSLVIYGIAASFISRDVQIEQIFIAAFVAAVAVALFGILQNFELVYLPKTQYGQRNPGSLMGLTNFAAEFSIMPFAMSVALWATTERRLYKLFFGLGSAIILCYLLLVENRAAWVALTVEAVLGLGIYCRYWAGRKLAWRPSVLFSAVVLILLSALALGRTDYGKHLGQRAASVFRPVDSSAQARILTWKAAWRIFQDRPFLGVGLANFEVFLPKYASPELERLYLLSNTRVDQAHNEYVQILVESGVLGLGAFIAVIASVIWLSIRNFKTISSSRELWQFIALVTGIAGLLVNMLFTFALRVPSTALYFWLGLGLLQGSGSELPANRIIRRPARILAVLSAGFILYLAYYSARTMKADLNHETAETYLGMKAWPEAVVQATNAIHENPDIDKYYYTRALAELNLRDYKSAGADLQRCLALAPHFERARFRLASTYYQQREFQKARDEFLAAGPVMRSRKDQLASALVSVYVGLGDCAKALQAGQETVRLEPRNVKYHYDLAYAYSVCGRYDKAIAECRKALELKPDFSPAKALLAQIPEKISHAPQP